MAAIALTAFLQDGDDYIRLSNTRSTWKELDHIANVTKMIWQRNTARKTVNHQGRLSKIICPRT